MDTAVALLRIQRLVGEGRMAEAVDRLRPLLAEAPDCLVGWQLMAAAKFHLKDFDGAIEASERQLVLRPDEPWGWVSRGLCMAEDGRDGEALSCYARALDLCGGEVNAVVAEAAWREVGKSHFRLEHYDDSEAAFQKALQINSLAAETWRELAIMRHAAGHTDAALRAVDRAVSLDPHDAKAWNERAGLFIRKANALASSADDRVLVTRLALLREALRSLDGAEIADPGNELAHHNREALIDFAGEFLRRVPTMDGQPGVPPLPQAPV